MGRAKDKYLLPHWVAASREKRRQRRPALTLFRPDSRTATTRGVQGTPPTEARLGRSLYTPRHAAEPNESRPVRRRSSGVCQCAASRVHKATPGNSIAAK